MAKLSDRPDTLTPIDVEVEWRIPRATQKKARAAGTFAAHYAVGRRIYYRRATFEQWILEQESKAAECHASMQTSANLHRGGVQSADNRLEDPSRGDVEIIDAEGPAVRGASSSNEVPVQL